MASEIAGFRLSPQQRRVWSANPEVNRACAQAMVTVETGIDPAKVQQALAGIITQQEILRTAFVRQAGSRFPLQVIQHSPRLSWRQEDLQETCPPEQAARLRSLAEEERRSLDLESAPVLRACLVNLVTKSGILIVTLPALCADRRTLALLCAELQRSYSGESAPVETLQYADYSQWQNERREGHDAGATEGKTFWEQDFRPYPALTLPLTLKATSSAADYRKQTVELEGELSAQIKERAERNGTVPATFLLAAWQTVLFRLSQQEAFLLGYVADGRNDPELSEAFGLFARTVPLCCNLSSDQSFTQFLSQVKETMARIADLQDYAPESWNDPGPDLGVVFEADRLPSGGFGDLTIEVVTEPYRLKLVASERDGEWLLTIHYDACRFEDKHIQRIADHLHTLIASVAADPDVPLESLDILSEENRRRMLEDWNTTAASYPRESCLQTLFEQQVARSPQAVALVGADGAFTYRELNTSANRLAHLLRTAGVGRGTRVGLLMERSARMIVGALGILKAGGAYVPLAPDAPLSRLAFQLQQTGAPVVVTQTWLRDLLSEYDGRQICLDSDPLIGQPETDPESVNQPDDVVYVIYTSGSTGQPKGVENTHRGLVNYATFIRSLWETGEPLNGMQVATVSPLSADLGNTGVFPCLISGATLHILSYETGMDAGLFAAYVSQHGLDMLKITPSHLNALLSSPEGTSVLPRRFLFLGGEALSWELVARIREKGTCRLFNHYGPTETTIGSLTYLVPADVSGTATVPIGRPIANTYIYLLDARLLPVPVGAPGEVYIGGDGVAKGYTGQPDLTEARFIVNPFRTDGSRLYRTGDIARYLPDGTVEFLGRCDDQVKIRGFRVEPGEIEAILRAHPGVHQAVVVTSEQGGEKRLIGYYIGAAPSGDDLKTHLQKLLPDYMIPWQMIRLTTLPLTANGKVDRAALPTPETAARHDVTSRLLPQTPVEHEIAGIFREVLGIADIGPADDFFQLGGHSLLAIQVMSRVREAFQIQIPMNALFDSPTVASLAQAILMEKDGAIGRHEMDALLKDLENLSDEEAEALLSGDGVR